MKILFLLFPLILLLVQGAAGSATTCWRHRGICSRHFCPHGTIPSGICVPGVLCCRR
ncbi:AMP1 protein, partial [Paradoxornis webbianus]|nr:AMP1 protein [Sinosuthora webbiana]